MWNFPEERGGIAPFSHRVAQFYTQRIEASPLAVLHPDLFVGSAERKRIVTCAMEELDEETTK